MKTFIATASLAGALVVGPIADASAWTRNGSVTTWRGTYTVHGGGGCAGGTCGWSRTVTGPYGGTWSHGGSVTRTGPGQFSYWGHATGPYGGTVTRSGIIRVRPPAY